MIICQSGFLLNFKQSIFIMSTTSTPLQVTPLNMSLKVWHKMLYGVARSIAVQQLEKENKWKPGTPKRKPGKKTT